MTQNVLTADERRTMAERINNVFRPSSPVGRRDMFAGRVQELGQLRDVVETTGQHAVLYGDRGVGKTSLARVHELLLNGSASTMRITCHSNTDYVSLWDDGFRKLALTGPRLEYSVVNPSEVARSLQSVSNQQPLVVYVDEMDRIRDAECRRLLSDTLKILADEELAVTVVLIGVADDATQLVYDHRSVARCLKQIPMKFMEDSDLLSFARKAFAEIGLEVNEQAIQDLVFLSMGLPMFVHSLGKEAAKLAIEDGARRVSIRHTAEAVTKSWSSLDATIQEGYDRAVHGAHGTAQAGLLLACGIAQTRSVREGSFGRYFTLKDVRIAQMQLKGSERLAAIAHERLERFTHASRGHILVKKRFSKSEIRYRFEMPTVAPYVIHRSLVDGVIGRASLDRILRHT